MLDRYLAEKYKNSVSKPQEMSIESIEQIDGMTFEVLNQTKTVDETS